MVVLIDIFSVIQVTDCEDRLRNDLDCVGWGLKSTPTLQVTTEFVLLAAFVGYLCSLYMKNICCPGGMA